MNQWPLVIVPVYNAVAATTACLDALARNLPPGANVLLINDASTDAAISPLLEMYKQSNNWLLINNPVNLGFVKTANIGLRSAAADAVLLNSDAVVTSDWLPRLQRAAATDPAIATVTPWTNNGEIASLPGFCQANPVPADPEAVARVIAASGPAEYPQLPTAVGFCMLITAKAIRQLGYFDDTTFGLGYGEENDYSRRAVNAGLRNVLCDNAYVCHLGNQSFGPRGLSPGDESMRRLLNCHPDYLEIVGSYISEDPLAKRREKLLAALSAEGVALD
ncbi:MAG: glycosyltransferase family 2 protein [Proteobacteria bacterium]|nr:glycosyltransferase family 2 protein [Pseudomonadota bacterium]